MNGTRDVALAPYTTFRVGGSADVLYEAYTVGDLADIARLHSDEPITVLGGGSNVLIADEGIRGAVILIRIPGISYEHAGDFVRVIAGAGESWDAFVADTIAHGASGLENLSGIPGSVGASPVQNIGAYGTEIKNVLEWVEVFDVRTKNLYQLDSAACAFGYRDSIFKKNGGARLVVTRVSFLLPKSFTPNVAYRDIEAYFSGRKPDSAQDVRNAVLSIRAEKFPDLSVVGTAGSFFKNPIIPEDQFGRLKEKNPNIQGFSDGTGRVKVSVAWILDHILHLNGVKEGSVSCHATQPLVVCAHEGATAHDIDVFAKKIETLVYDATHITLEREVRMLS